MAWIKTAFMVGLLLCSMPPAYAEGVPEPAGYRTENYRAPVPDTVKGGTVVTLDEAVVLWKEKGAVFLDVLPHDPKPQNLPAGTIWKEKLREDIPGSIWLANVGYGVLNQEMNNYFKAALETLTRGDKERKILFYCQQDCWMSWNAARRAADWGYRSVLWYPAGTDGWRTAGLPLEKQTPYEGKQ